MKKALFTAMIIALTSIMAHAQTTSVPPLINYQGMLTDTSGKALTGTHKLEFNLYGAAIGGDSVWGPQIFGSVPFINGRFNVILSVADNGTDSIGDAFTSAERYLGIKVDDGQEISPRQRILSAPYAISADNAKNADSAKNAKNADNADLLQNKGLDELSSVFREPDYDSGWFDIERTNRTYKFEIGFDGLPKFITAYYKRENGQILAWGMNQYGDEHQSNGVLLDFDEQGNLFVRLPANNVLHIGIYCNRDDDANERIYNQLNVGFRVMLWK